jgi:hypothetical protein
MFEWDVFLELLRNRGVTNLCPTCGTDAEWGHGDHLAGLVLLDEKRNVKPHGGIAVAALVCRNCGYLRLFVPAAIEGYGPEGPNEIV